MTAICDIKDLQNLARKRVPRMFYEYADSGSWTQSTYRANESDFQDIKLRQRVAVDITERSVKTEMIGQPASMPVALAPVGLTGMQHPDGEIKAARAAEKFGVPFTLSTMSICSIEDVAEHTSKPFWFQLYVMKDRDFIGRLIDRAKDAGCSALMLTLDLQILGQRHNDLRNGLSAPPKPTLNAALQVISRPRWCMDMLTTRRHSFRNIVGHAKGVGDLSSLSSWTAEQFDPKLSWQDIDWIKERWGGKLIIKGILDPEDAWRSMPAATRSSYPTTAAASSTARNRRSARCLLSSQRSARTSRCISTAVSVPARTCSRRFASAPKALTSGAPSSTGSAPAAKPASNRRSTSSTANSIRRWRCAANACCKISATTTC
jgi:isopentenyl diphosphate isomerase/L-lactate dehydrogenase-like FMN-dependent dehydrogenase